jgi:HK97 family phage portal protein
MAFIDYFKRPTKKEFDLLFSEIQKANQIYQLLYENIVKGFPLSKDSNMKDYVDGGFAGNPTVYSIASKIAIMASQVPAVVTDKKTGDVIEDTDLNKILKHPNPYQTFIEFIALCETFYLITGNEIIYAPVLEAGNDKGKLIHGLYMMPTQNVSIKSEGWMNPAAKYTLDINQRFDIDAKDIIHVRMMNLDYEDGANFMGMSPIKVAVNVIEADNQGKMIVANTLKRGVPLGIFSTDQETEIGSDTREKLSNLRREYVREYTSSGTHKRAGIPIFAGGKVVWTPISFTNFKDLQIIENSENGLRALCNVWGVPSELFNDTSASTYNNVSEARKAIYTNRIIPDLNLFYSYFNDRITQAYGDNIIVKADFSGIPELQMNKKEQSEWLNIGVQAGAINRNEYRKAIGFEPVDTPGMDDYLVNPLLIPINQLSIGMPTEDEVDNTLKQADLEPYKYIKIA